MTVLNRGRDGGAKPNEIGHIASQGASHSMPSTATTTAYDRTTARDRWSVAQELPPSFKGRHTEPHREDGLTTR